MQVVLKGSVLHCPNCGVNVIHHETTEIFPRDEDAETGLHVVVGNGEVRTDQDLTRNPSTRRDGLLIKFWCEQCEAHPVLMICQHKGQTQMEFVEPEETGHPSHT